MDTLTFFLVGGVILAVLFIGMGVLGIFVLVKLVKWAWNKGDRKDDREVVYEK